MAAPRQAHGSEQLIAAMSLLRRDRRLGLVAFNNLFRNGRPPAKPLVATYAGRFEAFDVAPGLTQLVELAATMWMPWQGKVFEPAQAVGYNVLTSASFPLVRIVAPSYHTFLPHRGATYQAFPFKTYMATSREDPDRLVLKIDYDVAPNPRWSVRRLQDELVQLEEGVYLGKAYFKWWWGSWQLWAYFSLCDSSQHRSSS